MTAVARPKPKAKRGPRGPYKKRKMKMSDTVAPANPTTQPYSQFVEELAEQLATRDRDITLRLAEIETESDALEVEEAALKQEQEKVQAGIQALEK